MKKIATVVGLGVSGFGAALLLSKKGWKVRVTEENKSPEVKERARILAQKDPRIACEIGRHTRSYTEGSSLVVTSPGATDSSKPLAWARELNIPIIDEIELGYRFCPARIIAVTGTNGKSTTVTLIGEILRNGGYKTVVCGNIGQSFCEKVANISAEDLIVLEVSSFQLERTDTFRPYVSLFLNITQNHLDRHKKFNKYLKAKLKIFKNQKKSDWAILNYEDKNLKGLHKYIKPRILYFSSSSTLNGAHLKEGAIWVDGNTESKKLLSLKELPLKEEHNLENYMAALLVARIFEVDPKIMKDTIKNFKGLVHRCEYVTQLGGVRFINDSKATTVDAAMHAIRSLERDVILIAGGKDKDSDFTVLRNLVEERVKAIVLIGEAKKKIRTQLLGTAPIYEAKDLDGAVLQSFNLAKKNNTVLLSPMCASFDMFKNFEERGDFFKKAVNALQERLAKTEACKIR